MRQERSRRRTAAGIVGAGLLTGLAAVGTLAPRLMAQAPEPRIWQGVYTAAQAERGKETFGTACLRCHGPALEGNTAPALKGDRFYASWGNEPIDRLFLKIRDTMPPNFGSTMDDATKLEIVAYILQTNGYPAGTRELAVGGEDLASAQILKKGQQAAVQNFALVQTVGCLARDGERWMLTQTAEPITTRDDAPSTSVLQAAAARPLGSRRFWLISTAPFEPAAHVGEKMEARGLIYSDESDSRISLTSLKATGAKCS